MAFSFLNCSLWIVCEADTICIFHCEDKEITTEALNCAYLDTSLQVISGEENVFASDGKGNNFENIVAFVSESSTWLSN